MATNVGNLVARLEMKAGKFISEMKKTSKATQKTQRQLQSFARVGKTAFGFLVGGSLVNAAKNIANTAQSLELMSARLGVNARSLQAWQLIGERFLVTQQSLSTGIQRLTRRASEAAKGTGEAVAALRELGIEARSFANLPLDRKILDLARAFEEVKTDSDRVRLAFKLFDTEGVGFLQFLKEGEERLAAMRKQLDTSIWSDEEREKISDANKRLTALGQSLELAGGQLSTFLINLADPVTKVLDDLLRFVRIQSGAARTGTSDSGTPVSIKKPGFKFADGAKTLEEAIRNSIELRKETAKFFKEIEAKRQAAKDTFVNLFSQNMVQAAEFGFKSILRSWVQTLQQMVAKAIASKLFGLLAGSAFGKSGVGKLLGFAEGGVVPGPRGAAQLAVVHGGEAITPPGRFGGDINISVDARGAVPGMEVLIQRGVQQAIDASGFNERERRKRA